MPHGRLTLRGKAASFSLGLIVLIASPTWGSLAAEAGNGPLRPGFSVKGKAVLRGIPPPEKMLPLDAHCAAMHQNPPTTRFYTVAQDGGLGDVVVFVSAGLAPRAFPPPLQSHVVAQRGCMYLSWVSAARTGQPIQVINGDPVPHNIHATPRNPRNRERSLAQLGGRTAEFAFDAPELFMRLKCDVHPWEYHYLSVFDHPFFAVTDENGEFQLPPLPEGTYTIEAHHRGAGIQKAEIVVTGENKPVEFLFDVPPEP